MELFLNLAGAFVALALICLWLVCALRAGDTDAHRRTQIIALALLILVLFPVISVTDDLLAAENPAEIDSVQRRNQDACSWHATVAPASLPVEPGSVKLPPVPCRYSAAQVVPLLLPAAPALAPIESRPPPTV